MGRESVGERASGERLRGEETAETKGPRRPGRPQTPAWPFAACLTHAEGQGARESARD